VADGDRFASNVEIVRAMLLAFAEGRVDDAIGFLHPGVGIRPALRPGLPTYRGHTAARRLHEALRRSGELGPGQAYDGFAERPGGRVEVRSCRLVAIGQGAVIEWSRTLTVLVVGGLVTDVYGWTIDEVTPARAPSRS